MRRNAKRSTRTLEQYHQVAADLRRCLALADIAAEYGNADRAAWYLVGALRDLVPDLRALRASARP